MGSTLKVSKLDAARRQLEAAIDLYSRHGDEVAIHTLAAAAYDVLRDLNEAQGGGPMIKDIHKYVDPQHAELLRKKLNEAQNFFKHADRDPGSVHSFKPLQTETLLFEACLKHRELSGRITPLLAVYSVWFMLLNRDIFEKQPTFAKVLNNLSEWSAAKDRTRFFHTWLDDAGEILKGLPESGA